MGEVHHDKQLETDAAAERARRIAWLKIWGPSILLVLIGFIVAYQFMDPAPPRSITMATGPTGGSYAGFGTAYSDVLADTLHINLQETAGSVENLRLLQQGVVDLAFVQGGTALPGDAAGLEALGTVYLEPLWVFYRSETELTQLSQLAGKRVAVGSANSGTQMLSEMLLEDNGIEEEDTTLLELGGQEAIDALKNGEVDAVFLVISATSPWVEDLLTTPEIRLMDFRRHLAYRGKHRFLTSVVLGEGVMDLERNIPPKEYTLLAPAAMLIARAELHPALTGLILRTAKEVHSTDGIFVRMGPFPTTDYIDEEFPLDDEAKRYYEFGPSILQRYLPFWAATFIDRMKIMLLPLVTLLLPLIKLGPPIYVWRTRVKIYRWYSVLREIDQRHVAGGTHSTAQSDLQRLDQLEKELNDISVPLSYMTEFYDLRLHIAHVRTKIERG